MKIVSAAVAAIALLCLCVGAQANVFNMGSGLTSLEMVTVGDAGNAADGTGYGSVGYAYNIGKYEVTAGQYTAFLNATAATDTYGLYDTYMWDDSQGCKIQRSGSDGSYIYSVASDYANRPVNFVSYWDSCRFVNWLCNGQGTGSTETGAYTLNGYNGADGRTIQRNAGATWAVTSEDEWYKAAYYKGGNTNAGYWQYPTQSNSKPSNQLVDPTDPGNNVTYYNNGYTIGSPYYRTEVGAHENSDSAYGTFDQGGNVWEWNEAIIYEDSTYAARGLRGGSFHYAGADFIYLQSLTRDVHGDPSTENSSSGFRVSQAVPEPSSIIALLGGLTGLIGLRRRKAYPFALWPFYPFCPP